MDEQKPTSSWDDLIKQIGAAPAPDALQRKRPAIETTFDPPPAINPAAVKPKPGDWNALADKLGIEVTEPAEPSRKRTPDSDYGGPSSKSLEASLAEIEPIESMFEEIIEDEVSDIEFEADDDSDLDEDDSELDDDDDDDSDLEDDSDLDDDDESDLSDEADDGDDKDDASETLSGEAARSAFEALFQAGSFAAMPPMKKPPVAREPQEPRRPQWRDPDEDRNEASRGDDSDERLEFDEPTPQGEAAGDAASAATDEGGRPRRRRRRRGGRGRQGTPRNEPTADREARTGSDDASEEWADTPLGEDDSHDEGEREAGAVEGGDGEKPTRRRRVRRRRRRGGPAEGSDASPPVPRAAANGRPPARASDDDDDEEQDDDDMVVTESAGRAEPDDDDDDDELPRESHKNIPTWSEAISVMVETNMESRKNSPSRPSGPRDRGRGRGRGGRGGSGGGGGSGRRGKP